MTRAGTTFWASLLLAAVAAPAPAQVRDSMTTGVQPTPPPAPVPVPVPVPYPYGVPLQSPDTRTAKERCWDAELARLGGEPTELDRRTIDLKCSQR
jgi:hypothetical protein